MGLTKREKKIINNEIDETSSKFLLIWFIGIILLFLLASVTTETFLLVIGPLNNSFFSLIFDLFFVGSMIGIIIISLKSYSNHLSKFSKKNYLEFFVEIIFGCFVSVIFALFGIWTLLTNFELYPNIPKNVVANLGIADILKSFPTLIFLVTGLLVVVIFRKNRSSLFSIFTILGFIIILQSSSFFLGYLTSYNPPVDPIFPHIVFDREQAIANAIVMDAYAKTSYLMFFIAIQLAFYLFTHAIYVIMNPKKKFLPKKIYLVFFILIVSSLVLCSSSEINHSNVSYSGYYLSSSTFLVGGYRIKEMTLMSAIVSFSIQAIPLCIILYYLHQIPEWITPERRSWLKRFKYAIYLFLIYITLDSVSGLRNQLTESFISPFNPIEVYKFLFILSTLIFVLALLTIYSAIPEIEEWFFDELKFRISSEVSEINTEPNFSRIWKIVDDLERTKPIKDRINQKTLDNYLLMAKEMVKKEGL